MAADHRPPGRGPAEAPLDGVTVVDLTRHLAGPYCTLLLAELGASVLKIEPPGGDPHRSRPPLVRGWSVPFVSLNRGKRSLVLDLKSAAGRRRFDDLVAAADVLVESFTPGVMERLGLGWPDLHRRHPHLVYCALSGFGQTGPDARRRADDMAIQACSGLMWATGHPDDGPTRVAPPLGALAGSLFAAFGIGAALRHRASTGRGSMVDVAMLDSMVALLEYPIVHVAVAGVAPVRNGARHPAATPAQAYRTADGHLVIMAPSERDFARLADALGMPDAVSDSRFADVAARTANRDLLQALIEQRLAQGTAHQWFDALSAAGVACGPVHRLDQAVADPQVQARGAIGRAILPDGSDLRVVASPIRCRGMPAGDRCVAPPVLDEAAMLMPSPRRSGPSGAAAPQSGAGLLAGVTVVDLTRYLAGPFATMLLAELGATVIKVEPPHGDETRRFAPRLDGQSGYFVSVNRGKLGIALDLTREADCTVFDALLGQADVLVENFRPGVMAGLGYDPADLRVRFPNLVIASISGFGQDGPYRRRAAYDMTVQAISGLMSVTGHPGSGPTRAGVSIGDTAAALFAAVGIAAALAGGRGAWLDIAMLDSLLALMGSDYADHLNAGRSAASIGAWHAEATPLGAFRARDGYLQVTASRESDFAALCAALGSPGLVTDPRFAAADRRTRHRAELAAELERALGTADVAAWVHRLRQAGLICEPVHTVEQMMASPQLAARNMIVTIEDPAAGPVRLAGNPVKSTAASDPPTRRPAPGLDADRDRILAWLRAPAGSAALFDGGRGP